eukprot:2658600-Rhodomonas_salina.1
MNAHMYVCSVHVLLLVRPRANLHHPDPKTLDARCDNACVWCGATDLKGACTQESTCTCMHVLIQDSNLSVRLHAPGENFWRNPRWRLVAVVEGKSCEVE